MWVKKWIYMHVPIAPRGGWYSNRLLSTLSTFNLARVNRKFSGKLACTPRAVTIPTTQTVAVHGLSTLLCTLDSGFIEFDVECVQPIFEKIIRKSNFIVEFLSRPCLRALQTVFSNKHKIILLFCGISILGFQSPGEFHFIKYSCC